MVWRPGVVPSLLAWCCSWAPGILSSVKDKNLCGGFYEEEFGVILPYLGQHTECLWIINMDPGYKVLLEVRHL